MTARSAARAEAFQPGHLTWSTLASHRHWIWKNQGISFWQICKHPAILSTSFHPLPTPHTLTLPSTTITPFQTYLTPYSPCLFFCLNRVDGLITWIKYQRLQFWIAQLCTCNVVTFFAVEILTINIIIYFVISDATATIVKVWFASHHSFHWFVPTHSLYNLYELVETVAARGFLVSRGIVHVGACLSSPLPISPFISRRLRSGPS